MRHVSPPGLLLGNSVCCKIEDKKKQLFLHSNRWLHFTNPELILCHISRQNSTLHLCQILWGELQGGKYFRMQENCFKFLSILSFFESILCKSRNDIVSQGFDFWERSRGADGFFLKKDGFFLLLRAQPGKNIFSFLNLDHLNNLCWKSMLWVVLRQNFPRKPNRLCAGLSEFFGYQGTKQTCPKAKLVQVLSSVGWDHSQGVPELLHCPRAVGGCVALRSAWWGPSFMLPNPCCSQDSARKWCSGSFWTSHLHQCCATSALSISRLSCPSLPSHLGTAHRLAEFSALLQTSIASSLRTGIITPFQIITPFLDSLKSVEVVSD